MHEYRTPILQKFLKRNQIEEAVAVNHIEIVVYPILQKKSMQERIIVQ